MILSCCEERMHGGSGEGWEMRTRGGSGEGWEQVGGTVDKGALEEAVTLFRNGCFIACAQE